MGFKYFLFHSFVHLFLIELIYFTFDLNIYQLFLIFFFSVIIDVDHLPFIMSHGIKYWFKISWDTHEPRAYPLHKFLIIVIFSVGAFLVLLPQFFIFGVCSLSVSLHLLWDLFEDAIIFKMGVKHWM